MTNNNTNNTIADARERQQAIDHATSYIVQAPAGSGKTELLIQRYLNLLAYVDDPEEIIAITFTRKAAAEMRMRVLESLHKAAHQPKPEQEHAQRTWQLAQSVLTRNKERNWSIAENPLRLRIQTIDSLCAALTRQMPVLSGFGAQPETTENARDLYVEAARRTLEELESDTHWSDAIARLLQHLDNDMAQLESLLASLLPQREQWQNYLHADRELLEMALGKMATTQLNAVLESFPFELTEELVALACYAAAQLPEEKQDSPIRACRDLTALPVAHASQLEVWRGVIALLLTNDGGWRKQINKNIGFPTGKKGTPEAQMKERFTALLAALESHTTLCEQLARVRLLPPASYTEAQWEVMMALFSLLERALAELRVLFAEHGQMDFNGIAEAAVHALGSHDQPTDLVLRLDYRIAHLLVDEFQDTSTLQYALLSGLTAGWQRGDGRTLFLVGDPMQSIYRFRAAEVGLFQSIWQHQKLGDVELTPIRLSVNFRSQHNIVAWVNNAFTQVFPASGDIASGAVAYTQSVAFHPAADGPAVVVHPFCRDDWAEAEAQKVVDLVTAAEAVNPKGSIAILVRNRSHLARIIPALRQAGISFRAVEIDTLADLPVVSDLITLTRALTHLADRVAWLAMLRAPWCGLTLTDLHQLVGYNYQATVWELLHDETLLQRLPEASWLRLQRVREVIALCLAERRRCNLRRTIEGAWLALGGPACVAAADLVNAEAFFELLERFDCGGDVQDLEHLQEQVASLFAKPDTAASSTLQIMTMHKAKGLQFDTVIVPGLGRGKRPDDTRLLLWLEYPHGPHDIDLLLAPIKAASEESNPIYGYIKALEEDKIRYEEGRLLYVAATRAIRQLHLLGHVSCKEDGSFSPPTQRTLLGQLWPVVAEYFLENVPSSKDTAPALAIQQTLAAHPIQRHTLTWRLPPPPMAVVWGRVSNISVTSLEMPVFQWAGMTIRHVGTLVHRLLQRIHQEGVAHWPISRIADMDGFLRAELRALGVAENELEQALAHTRQAIMNTLTDERGRWLLASQWPESACELRLSGQYRGQMITVAIDRTFVDDTGQRWIVDYKTSLHSGGDVEAFLSEQVLRYRAQLECYKALMAGLDVRPIRLGLYFPLQAGWREL